MLPSQIFNVKNMSFNAIGEIKILAKSLECIVYLLQYPLYSIGFPHMD